MNISEKEERLKGILEHNIKNEKIGTAIAITGSWGVGKTFFWNKFLKDVTQKEKEDKKDFFYEASRISYKSIFDCHKYAYISLFGIENLSDLKNTICTKLSLNPYAKLDVGRFEFIQLLKNTIAQFRDLKVSNYGVSASARILESLLFLQVKDAIICFDDFERMSNKLDIKDVMGLANYLKLEKNCQVILILDEDKAEGDNKKKYADYKEKLIDETIVINSVEPLIRENAKDIDDELVNLMIDFADKLDIHNFRFFQKVIKLYRDFRKSLPEVVADSTKEIILVRILQGYLIHDFKKLEYDWNDCQYYSEREKENWSSIKKLTYDNLREISYFFIKDDLWLIEFKKWFEQKDEVDFKSLKELATSEMISEKQSQVRLEIKRLMVQWRNLEITESFCEQLHFYAIRSIGFDNLENLNFFRVLLAKFGRNDLAKDLRNKIKQWIDAEIQTHGEFFVEDTFSFGYKENNLFHRYIKILAKRNPLAGLPSLIEVVKQYVVHSGYNTRTSALVLEQASKEDWRKLLFETINYDDELKEISRLVIIRKMIRQSIEPELNPKIRQEILEVLKQKAEESELIKLNVDYIITRLDD
ncbi:P-loop NTPase fold protein [Acinetobacter haemolyticus]|uniref:P-loop NTPase fold protein n=2 Tax=Acinetobacter haemolyticus TaxID=29430 RepID=UPI000C2CC191|nr:P-loop NTPase fold protein [Acinetobacter haemolyticus]ATZ66053.1 KAP family P-loop domain protein [Acinetobacter haemolyticus]